MGWLSKGSGTQTPLACGSVVGVWGVMIGPPPWPPQHLVLLLINDTCVSLRTAPLTPLVPQTYKTYIHWDWGHLCEK